MKKFIIKTNEWYESLPKTTGELFYLFLLIAPFITLFCILPIDLLSMSYLWPLLVIIWRLSFDLLKENSMDEVIDVLDDTEVKEDKLYTLDQMKTVYGMGRKGKLIRAFNEYIKSLDDNKI